MKVMVGPQVTRVGKLRLLARVRVGRAEVDQALERAARAQLVVGEIVLARKVRVSIFVSYDFVC